MSEGRARSDGGGEAAGSNGFHRALRWRLLTPLYDPLMRAGLRLLGPGEATLKEALIAQAGLQPGHRVLDLGCGTGTLTLMAKRRAPGAEVVGLDADPDVLAIAREKARKAGVDVALDRGFSTRLPYPDAAFDAVLSSLFFHHVTTPETRRTLREVARVLRPGGELHVADWGPPRGALQSAAFLGVRAFDGFHNTRDNARGLLPERFREAGLETVGETRRFPTALGALALYGARKPP